MENLENLEKIACEKIQRDLEIAKDELEETIQEIDYRRSREVDDDDDDILVVYNKKRDYLEDYIYDLENLEKTEDEILKEFVTKFIDNLISEPLYIDDDINKMVNEKFGELLLKINDEKKINDDSK